jgi:ketosteroid isomerase-like protein
MSSEDVETIRAGVAALNRGDVDGMAATLDPDVELVPLRAALDGSVYVGHEGLRRWMADMAEDWPHFKLALGQIRELQPGQVLVEATMHLRGQSGVKLDSPAAWLCDVREGKVARIRFYADSAAALAAAESTNG